jgi:hypothetical protein
MAEVNRLVELAADRKAELVVLGGGRDVGSQEAICAFEAAWTRSGGHVLEVVDWPAQAASWLRPARRLTACEPDLWVVCDTPAGWAQMARRLTVSTGWAAGRTLGFAALATITAVEAAGPGVLDGMTGATAEGGKWWIGGGLFFRTDDPSKGAAGD